MTGSARILFALAFGCSMATSARCADAGSGDSPHVRLDETIITGNEELPKVLYIVPWQDEGALPKLGMDPSVIDFDVFRRVEPDSYRRQLQRRQSLDSTAPVE